MTLKIPALAPGAATPVPRWPGCQNPMRPDSYKILARAVEEGVAYGYARAHKHSDDPGPEVIQTQIEQAVMDAICEVFRFEGVDECG